MEEEEEEGEEGRAQSQRFAARPDVIPRYSRDKPDDATTLGIFLHTAECEFAVYTARQCSSPAEIIGLNALYHFCAFFTKSGICVFFFVFCFSNGFLPFVEMFRCFQFEKYLQRDAPFYIEAA